MSDTYQRTTLARTALICLLFVVHLLATFCHPATVTASAASPSDSEMPTFELCRTDHAPVWVDDRDIALAAVKRWESLTLEPYFDVDAWRSGWGTPSASPSERITLEEADRRCAEIFDAVLADIRIRYPERSNWEQLVLAVMDYNVNRFGPNLDRAIRSGDVDAMAAMMARYVNVRQPDGTMMPYDGLRARRAAEIELLRAKPHERQRIYHELTDTVAEHIQAAA